MHPEKFSTLMGHVENVIRMKWAGHVAHMGAIRNLYKV
jgi:hypothetical protein